MSTSRRSPRKLFGLLVVVSLLLQVWGARDILFKGQVIKQFHAHSLSASLAANGFHPLSTSLPCPDESTGVAPRAWAEEPPVFHFLGAICLKLGIDHPAVPGYLIGLGFLALMFVWTRAEESALFALIALSPVFTRYFCQHLPDLLAAFLLSWGMFLWLHQRRSFAVALFALACATKALVLIPVALVLFGEIDLNSSAKDRWRGWAAAALATALVAAPFFAWIRILHVEGVPNPFAFKSVVVNRHSGELGRLLQGEYWARFFTWVAAKGVGIPLFVFYLKRLWNDFRKFGGLRNDRREQVLVLWSLGLFVSWIFVRAGSYTHDYYFLPYFVPLAFLGGLEILRLRLEWAKLILIGWSVGVGLAQPVILNRGVAGTSFDFCATSESGH